MPNDIDFWIRTIILSDAVKARDEIDEGRNLRTTRERAGYNEYLNINIYQVINQTNIFNKEKQVEYLCQATGLYTTKETPFLINRPINVSST